LATEKVLEHGSIEYLVRKYNVRILEISNDCIVFLKAGHYIETQSLFEELAEKIGVLQFVRSGRIAITKSKVERLSDMLSKRELSNKSGDKQLSSIHGYTD
jgi:acetolactate synthase-1/3 small subunit